MIRREGHSIATCDFEVDVMRPICLNWCVDDVEGSIAK